MSLHFPTYETLERVSGREGRFAGNSLVQRRRQTCLVGRGVYTGIYTQIYLYTVVYAF